MATFITPVNVTPGVTGSFQDVNLSSYIPAGSTGVMLHVVNTSGSTRTFGLQKNGSTDNRTNTIAAGYHTWAAMGVDTGRILEINVSATDLQVWLTGYFGTEAVFFTNGIAKTPSAAWEDVSIASDTGADTAIGAIFEISGAGVFYFGARKNGSTDARVQNIANYHAFSCIIGVDASEICEVYRSTQSLYLTGYIKDKAVFNTNATDISLTPILAWTDLPALPTESVGAIIEIVSGVSIAGLRLNGSSEDIYRNIYPHLWAFVECDANGIIEGKINDTGCDFFVVGYLTTGKPGVAFSGTPLNGVAPLSVTFTDASSSAPTSWLWEYSKDGGSWTSFSTSQNPVYTFNAVGTYSIKLTATNTYGAGTLTKTNYIVLSGGSTLTKNLPMFTISAGDNGTAEPSPSFNMFSILAGMDGIIANLPMIGILAGGYAVEIMVLPALQGSGTVITYTDDFAASLPMFTIDSTLVMPHYFSASLPMFTTTSTEFAGEVSFLAQSLPRLTVLGTAVVGGQPVEVVGSLPMLTITANALVGRLGVGAGTFPFFTISATGAHTLAITSTATLTLPMFLLNSISLGLYPLDLYKVYVMNIKNSGVTEYKGYNFNSFCKYGDLYLAGQPGQVCLLQGTTDNGVNIEAKLRSGNWDMNQTRLKRLTDAYITMRTDGSYTLHLTTDDGRERIFPFTDTNWNLHPKKLDGIRGRKGRYWMWELRNKNGSKFELDSIELMIELLMGRK